MTWAELLVLLKSMEESEHTSMTESVSALVDGTFYPLDLSESLSTGEICLIQTHTKDYGDESE